MGLVHVEKRALDGAGGDAEPGGEITQDGQELKPVLEAEVHPPLVPAHGTDGVQKLPRTNIDHSVPFRIEEHQDG